MIYMNYVTVNLSLKSKTSEIFPEINKLIL